MSAARGPEELAIGIAFPGDTRSARAWSGIPAALAGALSELGVRVVHLGAAPPHRLHEAAMLASGVLRRNRSAGRHAPELARLRSALLARRIAAAPLDGVVQVGTDFELPAGGPRTVTYEDMTVRQALRQPEHGYATLPPPVAGAWIARQARAYARAAACCAASGWAAASIREEYGVPAAKVAVVGFGHRYALDPVTRDWDTPRLLFVGKTFERKNGPAVVRAFARVRERHPGATLDVVGRHGRLDAPGVTGHGELSLADPAGQARLRDLYLRATCFVLPSRYEPFGMVYLEAAAVGLPSIGTTAGGAATAVGPGGVLVDPDDDEALVRAMLDLADAERARTLGERARAHAARFTWGRVAERVLRALAPAGLATDDLEPLLDG